MYNLLQQTETVFLLQVSYVKINGDQFPTHQNALVFITEAKCIFCEVGNVFLNTMYDRTQGEDLY